MKSNFLWLSFLFTGIIANAQQDTALIRRVNEMLNYTQLKDLDKVMDYTYPRLFTIAPRDALMAAMKSAFETDEFVVELDSVKVHTIFPVFMMNDTSYVKVRHTMLMKMKYKKPYDISDKDSKESMVSLMEQRFGKGKVRFDPVANSLNIFMVPDMVGIKDRSSMWTFANLNEDNPAMLNMIFSKKVLDKLREFK
ncbi:MAG TPA: hypothetical protein VFH08_06080 [Chitinophagaceae bacterium]|nr:hypothetical protein [Chitinophagaceae bacterium]